MNNDTEINLHDSKINKSKNTDVALYRNTQVYHIYTNGGVQ